jgi:hypothetical protein
VTVLTDGKAGSSFGYHVCGIGNVNKDGYEDFAITIPGPMVPNNINKVVIYYGGMQLDTIPHGNPIIGYNIANVGDVNSNKYNDFMISGMSGNVRLYLHPDSMITIRNGVEIGKGGDINNDGYSDFIVGDDGYVNSQGVGAGGARIYFGAPIVDTVPKVLLTGEHRGDQYGYYISVLGDINGDGYSEIAVGAPSYPDYNNPLGKIYIYSFASTVGVADLSHSDLPLTLKLMQNYPNPFNPNTVISYQLSMKSYINLKIYDVVGREIVTLVSKQQSAGTYSVTWNADTFPSGLYFARLSAGNCAKSIKLLLLK